MATIATGTVVLWKRVPHSNKDDSIEYVSDTKVSVYVADGGEDDDVSAILAKYILDEVNKAAANNKPAKATALLEAARDGYLRVGNITRATVIRPAPR